MEPDCLAETYCVHAVRLRNPTQLPVHEVDNALPATDLSDLHLALDLHRISAIEDGTDVMRPNTKNVAAVRKSLRLALSGPLHAIAENDVVTVLGDRRRIDWRI
jgi:hypothetical protein